MNEALREPVKRDPKKVYFYHFGCRLNRFETLNLENNTSSAGMETSDPGQADYIIINTCTVTNRADVKNRGAIRNARQLNPKAKIIVTGCYATTDPEEIKEMKEVDLVIPNSNKSQIFEIIGGKSPSLLNNKPQNLFLSRPQTPGKLSRALLKIQDGCNKACSYCKIPQARGKGVSRNKSGIVSEVEQLIASGFQEIILTGINIGHYKFSEHHNFTGLLKDLLEIRGDYYYRISSLEPESLTRELIEFINNPKLAPFFHIPIQSASRNILKQMNRSPNLEWLKKKIKLLRQIRPDAHLGTDIIVGFPGETEEDFQNTMDFVQEAEFANVHIFPYSRRNNTPIDEKLKNGVLNMVHGDVVKERTVRLRTLTQELSQRYIDNTSGKVYRAIVETEGGDYFKITTENYLSCKLYGVKNLRKGEMIRIQYDKSLAANILT